MNEAPSIPDEIESKEELQEYIGQLQDHIQFLEEELEESEADKLQQEITELEEKASQPGSFASIMAPLEAIQDRIQEFEEGYLDEDSDYGLPDESPLNDALGADITQDPEDFKKELED